MFKDAFTQSCLAFFTVVALVGVIFIGFFYDSIGILKLPDVARQIPATLSALDGVHIEIQDIGIGGKESRGEWSNPLEDLPDPTMPVLPPTATAIPTTEPTATPVPTATPIPPLDPQVYQVETTERLKALSKALKNWLEYNQTLSEDTSRLNDPAWQEGMRKVLSEVTYTAYALAEVGPAPMEYRSIDALLDEVANEADGLSWNYTQAMKTGNSDSLQQAGEHFASLKAYLKQAAEQMLVLGWNLN